MSTATATAAEGTSPTEVAAPATNPPPKSATSGTNAAKPDVAIDLTQGKETVAAQPPSDATRAPEPFKEKGGLPHSQPQEVQGEKDPKDAKDLKFLPDQDQDVVIETRAEVVIQQTPQIEDAVATGSQLAAHENGLTPAAGDNKTLESPAPSTPSQAFPSLIDQDDIDGFLVLSAASPEILEADLKRKKEEARQELLREDREDRKRLKVQNRSPGESPEGNPSTTGRSEDINIVIKGTGGRFFRFEITRGEVVCFVPRFPLSFLMATTLLVFIRRWPFLTATSLRSPPKIWLSRMLQETRESRSSRWTSPTTF